MSFRFRNLGGIGNRVNVSLPTDDGALLGRECPASACEGYFKIKPGTGLSGPDLKCHCPYCGHTADPRDFTTKEQIEYAQSIAIRKISDALVKDLKQLEFNRPARGPLGIGISMKLKEGRPVAIRHYREKNLETEVVCESCTLTYAVFGLFAYCPDCRVHNSLQVLRRNLVLVSKQLELATGLADSELSRHLVEDALENCVSSFDGFGRETTRVRASTSESPARVERLSFQNLSIAAEKLQQYFSVDLRGAMDPDEWEIAQRAFLKRHVLSHKSGVVDEQYRASSGDTSAIVGRRIVIESGEVARLGVIIEKLGATLLRLLPQS